ncbi:hypothetical protein G6F55_001238 [Rhizopus delemar]|uniref:Protein Zds1 C-terminal domain-containing protein n=2 Tax=Rhizopus TaxID=4842 RepID=A0A9P7CUW6_9FUNG|nr:hypothetical protein G6F55_001238 [Rhizopus delemar]KAG1553419.1 hypothetical protein G6F51_000605 [Rhizopus arrhizus]KAG1503469.1 hypothetical protein G6F54_001658 [Rhizopus delemar]KAG1518588.1 hypothetical protein G6F53_000462 [Rhizopus delemar]KAG1521707.1 hypothetical protein G6F52_006502 [Rhizopus delemar]
MNESIEHDLYANVLLLQLLEREEKKKETKCLELTSDTIWVPADKHPQIAPEEFAKYIETQGSIVPTKRASSLQRRHTLLSESFTTDHDCSDDDSLIPSPTSPLLRRSAFSAKRKSNNKRNHYITTRRSASERKPDTVDNWNKLEGISLYDQPVNMSEWIDLGSASLEDDSERGIISRVHDAESQLRSHKEAKKSTSQPIVTVHKRTAWYTSLFQLNLKNSLTALLTRSLKNTINNSNHTVKKKTSRLDIPSIDLFYNNNRLPIHVERAIYRLSHMKLTSLKRPLYQQVLISNLIFWYLSIQHDTLINNNYLPNQPGNRMTRIVTQPIVVKQEEEDDLPLSHYMKSLN